MWFTTWIVVPVLWIILIVGSFLVGWTRIRTGVTDIARLAFDVATIPIDVLRGLYREILWTTVIVHLVSTALVVTGVSNENRFMVALGGIIGGGYLAFWWFIANSFAWYILKLVELAQDAVNLGLRVFFGVLNLMGILHSGEAQQIVIVDQKTVRNRVHATFGTLTATWIVMALLLTIAPYWETFGQIPVLALFAFTIVVLGMLSGAVANKVPKTLRKLTVVFFWIYALVLVFSLVSLRSDRIYAGLPHLAQSWAQYLGAASRKSQAENAQAAAEKEVAAMTLGRVTERTALREAKFDDEGHLISAKRIRILEKDQEFKPWDLKPEFHWKGEPLVRIELPDDLGEYDTSDEKRVLMVSLRKVRLGSAQSPSAPSATATTTTVMAPPPPKPPLGHFPIKPRERVVIPLDKSELKKGDQLLFDTHAPDEALLIQVGRQKTLAKHGKTVVKVEDPGDIMLENVSTNNLRVTFYLYHDSEPLPPDLEGSDNPLVRFVVRNERGSPIEIYWKDPSGTELLYGRLGSGGIFTGKSWTHNNWVVRDSSDGALIDRIERPQGPFDKTYND